jgi:diguanylate cyclase (GGDEF)-like protein
MSTMSPTTENKVRPVNSNGNIAALVDPSELFADLADKPSKIMQLPGLLQTTLNLEEILAQFSKEIAETIPHSNLGLISAPNDVNFVLGEPQRHSCTYELTINENKLGFLSFTRDTQFADSEISLLEKYICTLHYPIRNAILYRQAVSAASKDPLTGVGNRGAMNSSLHREIELAQRHNRSLGLIMMDVDHFKKINDTYGHSAGDKLLQSLVRCAEKSVRISDMIYRYGGEEFVIALPETDAAGVLRLAKRIRRRVEKLETTIGDQTVSMTISIGMTTLCENDDEKSFFGRADEALYRAKREGRNCIRIAGET